LTTATDDVLADKIEDELETSTSVEKQLPLPTDDVPRVPLVVQVDKPELPVTE
jgi:hypothetical protein